MTLLQKLHSRTAAVSVVGLGYVGLPLAAAFAEAGFQVVGIDVDERKVDAINRGESYIEDVSSGTLHALPHPIRATTNFWALRECDAVSICVPTPLRKTGDPDMSYIVRAADEVAQHLHRDMLVVLESTTYPGTTTEIVLPRLTGCGAELAVGEDFYLCFSPERVDPGRSDWTTRTTPKVIGGATPRCLEMGMALYGAALETLVPVSSTEAAEMVKLLENTFRAVNIAMANEVLLMCEKLGLEGWEVIEAAASKPFGFMKFTPGPGIGGHCIPIDPLYLSWKLKALKFTARFIELADEINASMPAYWARKVQDALNEAGKPLRGSRVLVLGVAYKRDVGDLRESPALDIIHLLRQGGAEVAYHDPYVPSFAHDGWTMASVPGLERALDEADCVLVVTDHSAYHWETIRQRARMVVDSRNAVRQGRVWERESSICAQDLPIGIHADKGEA
jgi:UDP-N-acetyl-D-glucosamine dehydrogenase